jgi:hypothetical protein
MCRGGGGFLGEDTALSEMTLLCQGACGSVAFCEDATFFREGGVLLTLIRTHYRNLIRKTKLYFSNRTSRVHIQYKYMY